MTNQIKIALPSGKPAEGSVHFIYRSKHWQGSSIETCGELTEEQNRAIVQIMQGKPVVYEGESK